MSLPKNTCMSLRIFIVKSPKIMRFPSVKMAKAIRDVLKINGKSKKLQLLPTPIGELASTLSSRMCTSKVIWALIIKN